MSLALMQNVWGEGREQLIKMKTPGSNNEKFWLWRSTVGPRNLPFQPAPQVMQVIYGQRFKKHCLAYIHPIFNDTNSKLWLATYVFIKGGKALNMYFMVPISAHIWNIILKILYHHSKPRRHIYDRLWLTLTAEADAKLVDLSCFTVLYIKVSGSPKSKMAKWTEEQDKTQVNFQQFSALCRKDLN